MLRIMLVDDHAVVRVGLERILREALTHVEIGHAGDGPQALDLALAGPWDVIVLDVSLPSVSGIEILKRLKRLGHAAKVLMLSMHAGRHYVLGSLKAGAAGYLSKESAPEELVDAIDTVLRGGTYISRQLAESLSGASLSAR